MRNKKQKKQKTKNKKKKKKQKKTEKTENTSMLQEILAKITTLTNDVADMKNQLCDINATIRNIVKDEISATENEWNVERNDLSKRLEIIEHRDEIRLRHDKKNNIIIRGLSCTTENYRQEVTDMLKEKLQLEVNVVDASLIKTTKLHLLWSKVGDMRTSARSC